MNGFFKMILVTSIIYFAVVKTAYSYCEGLEGNAGFNCKQAILAEQIQKEQWSLYSSREQELASSIGRINYEFFRVNGYLPQVTNETVAAMANSIGASNDELAFVIERMNGEYAYYSALNNVSSTLRDIDNLINNINSGSF